MVFKGAGFCITTDCIAYHRPQFYLGTEEAYRCRVCSKWGYLEQNRTMMEGYGLCRSVIVHFKYDALTRTYTSKAAVTDEAISLKENTRVLHVYYPFIHHKLSALKLAEKAMADVATGHSGITIDLSGDEKLFREALSKLEISLQTSEFLKANLGSSFVPLGRSK